MSRRMQMIPYRPKHLVNKHKRADFWFWTRYSAYPYTGCQHGCRFCYCREKKYLPYDDPQDFAYRIMVKENAAELMRRELRRAAVDVVFTGDYQAAERKFELSRRMLEVCLALGFPVYILERSPLVLRDLDLLREIHARGRAGAAFSVISTPDSPNYAAVERIEGLAPPATKRFAAMAELAAAGIPVGTSFMPALPGLCDDPKTIDDVVRWTAAHGGTYVLASSLTLADQQRDFFLGYLDETLPERAVEYRRLYPEGSYGPTGETHRRLALRVREACAKYGLRDRQPRPIIPGEKRAGNKRLVERLAEELYTLEIEAAAPAQQWALRSAAWAIEDLEQDAGLVLRTMGVRGLASLPGVGEAMARKIARMAGEDFNR